MFQMNNSSQIHEYMDEVVRMSLENVRQNNGGPFEQWWYKTERSSVEGPILSPRPTTPTAHAEIVALRNAAQTLADFRLTGCDLVTSCYPCPMCLGAIILVPHRPGVLPTPIPPKTRPGPGLMTKSCTRNTRARIRPKPCPLSAFNTPTPPRPWTNGFNSKTKSHTDSISSRRLG